MKTQNPSNDMSSSMKNKTKHSKKMPYWLWFIIAKSLGIKLHPNDKPLLSVILHAVTLFSGGGMLLTRIWFSGKTELGSVEFMEFYYYSHCEINFDEPSFIIYHFKKIRG